MNSGRRLAYMTITVDMLNEIIGLSGRYAALKTNLPADARVVWFEMATGGPMLGGPNRLNVVLQSESFAPLFNGQVIPCINLSVERGEHRQ